jgi:pimeloyl-ACP methyl ester carboxylesterase
MPPTVVYVPGLPGSHLKAPDGTRFFWNGSFSSPLLAGPDDLADDGVRAGDPILQALKFLSFDVGKKAKSLYQLLDDIGCRIVPFGWDWRRPVWEAAGGIGAVPRLAAAIRQARQQAGEPVTLICHSTGGLVARATLEAHPELARDLSRLLAFGVPWAGLVKSFREIAGRGGTPVLSAAHSQRIACRSWASFDLLPPDTATGLSMVERRGVGPISPLVDQAWLAGLPAAERAAAGLRAAAAAVRLAGRRRGLELGGVALEVVNVVGWGEPTPDLAAVSADGTAVEVRERSANHPADVIGLEGGDGTVPRRSAAWLRSTGNVRVTTLHLPVGWLTDSRKFPHTALWRNEGGRAVLRHLLAGEALPPLVYAALDAGDASFGSTANSVRVRVQALDTAGAPLPGATVRTVDLVGHGGPIETPIDPGHGGRHGIPVPKARIRSTPMAGKRLLRFRVEIGWQGPGGPATSGPIPFSFLQP